jgi:NAD(P)-dependent dehydrogenase (short-subunit alcohol dehydrogenase family)
MESKNIQSVVVTGVSTGIGWGISKVLIQNGYRVFGSVRKQADADRLKAEFGERFVPLLFDVRDQAAVRMAAGQVRAALGGQTLLGLVNNAGIALGGPLILQPLDEFRTQIEVNLVGPFIVTQEFAPLLGAGKTLQGAPGRIVNISSVGGKVGGPFLGAYVASKHGLEGMSETLRRELQLYGIDVIVVGPGEVATPIWDKAEAKGLDQYRGSDYGAAGEKFAKFFIAEGRKGLPVEQLGNVVLEALTAVKPPVRYAPVPKKFMMWILPNLLPKRVIDRFIGKQFGLLKKP